MIRHLAVVSVISKTLGAPASAVAMIGRLGLGAVLSITLAAPLAAQQSMTWLNQCMPGNLYACMDYSISLDYDPTPQVVQRMYGGAQFVTEGATTLTFGLSNLEDGSGLPFLWRMGVVLGLESTWTTQNNLPWFDIGPLEFETDGVVTVQDRDYLPETPVDEFRMWEAYASHASSPSYYGIPESTFWLYATDMYGLVGCSTPDVSFLFYRGCGATAYMQFLLPGQWSFTHRTRIDWEGYVLGGPGSRQWVHCTTGVDCVTVPEPGALLLIVTGVLGMAYMRRRSGVELLHAPGASISNTGSQV